LGCSVKIRASRGVGGVLEILGKSRFRATTRSGQYENYAISRGERMEKIEQPPGFRAYGDARILEKWVVCVTPALKGGVQMLKMRRKVVSEWQPRPIWSGQME
jgi:hypothetical protein